MGTTESKKDSNHNYCLAANNIVQALEYRINQTQKQDKPYVSTNNVILKNPPLNTHTYVTP